MANSPNRFAAKMSGLSSSELQRIVASKDYVAEARQAAKDELNKREGKPSEPHSKSGYKAVSPPITRPPKYQQEKKSKRTSRYHRNRLVSTAVAFTLIGIFFLFKATFFSSLNRWTRIEGTPLSSGVLIKDIMSNKTGNNYVESRKATLVVFLKEHEGNFIYWENIGKDLRSAKFDNIVRHLEKTDSVTLWFKAPNVIRQLELDGKVAISNSEKMREEGWVGLLILSLGTLMFLLYWRKERPEEYKKFISKIKI